ncbi:ABC transporter ATP-binding protein [Chloroflexota bacterium]
MIRVKELTKHYNSTLALDQLSLEVPVGSVFGLLGPNGAGKTTFLRLIMGFVFPDAGQIDRSSLLPTRIGYLPERAFYPPRFTVRDYLTTIGQLVGLRGRDLQQAVSRLLGELSIEEISSRRLSACSRGMLQRLGLAQALLGDPPLLLLDEPALGLDPVGQKFMRDQIIAQREAGRTVILSSHHLDEVMRVCTHIAVLSRGRLVRSGSLATMLSPQPKVTITTDPLPAALSLHLTSLHPGVVVMGDQVILTDGAVSFKAEILRMLLESRVDIRQLDELQATLEEIYLEATGG